MNADGAADHAAVYAAELAAFDGTTYELRIPFDSLAALAHRITSAAWWPCGEIAVLPARADAGSSSTLQRGDAAPVIRLAQPQLTPATLVHELAHVLAGVGQGHGAVYRRAQLDLVAAAFGATEAEWLLDAYAAMGLAPGARRWHEPPPYAGSLTLPASSGSPVRRPAPA